MPTGVYQRAKGIKRGPYRRVPIETRYWKYAIVQEGCWGWTGAKIGPGYGALNESGGGSIRLAHRLSWEIHNGPIPDGRHVLHRCDNPPCTNPAHLFLGTHAENMADKVAKGRARLAEHWKPTCTVLTAEIVQEMRRRYVPYRVTFKMLADEFHVSISAVQAAVHRQTWTEVP